MYRLFEWLRLGRSRIGEEVLAFWPVSVTSLALALLAVSLTIWAFIGNLPTGFSGKTLWDWIKVLGVPVTVAWIAGVLGFVTQRANNRAEDERDLNTDRAREATLRAYHDLMTGLVLDEQPQNSEPDSPVRAVAHAQTFAALRDLDGPRKGTIVQFLHDPKLILNSNPPREGVWLAS